MKTKIILLSIVAATAIAVMAVDCNTRNNIKNIPVTDTATLDVVEDSFLILDTNKEFEIKNVYNGKQTLGFSIDKISIQEEENMPESPSILRFNIDSLRTIGDTIKTISSDGSAIYIYTDRKTGKQVASISRRNGEKKTIEIDNIKLKTEDKNSKTDTAKKNKQ